MNVGDVVVLKSGGPPMAVETVVDDKGRKAVEVVWFDLETKSYLTRQFLVSLLEIAPGWKEG